MAKILIVEDEHDLSGLVRNWLCRENHLVEQAENGLEALARMETSKFDLIILDLMLPGMSGMEVCQQFRKKSGQTPILMLTAKDNVEDKAAGLDAGADDYLTKPFHLKELAARVRALLRRGLSRPGNTLKIRDIEIDASECRVTKNGQIVHLLPKEFRLFEFLVRHPNHVFSAEELLANVWESDTSALLDTVRGHITRLRKKIDTQNEPSIISTVYGMGYKIEAD
jgi:DNA-binding response OmpR family regulator